MPEPWPRPTRVRLGRAPAFSRSAARVMPGVDAAKPPPRAEVAAAGLALCAGALTAAVIFFCGAAFFLGGAAIFLGDAAFFLAGAAFLATAFLPAGFFF